MLRLAGIDIGEARLSAKRGNPSLCIGDLGLCCGGITTGHQIGDGGIVKVNLGLQIA
jgi:hypothetical protein